VRMHAFGVMLRCFAVLCSSQRQFTHRVWDMVRSWHSMSWESCTLYRLGCTLARSWPVNPEPCLRLLGPAGSECLMMAIVRKLLNPTWSTLNPGQ
jgi:hypothetical protein